MRANPILEEAYAAKEALAAKFGFDLHRLAESFRRSPSWKPVKRVPNLIHTAEKRLKELTQDDEVLRELRKVKEDISLRAASVQEIAAEARRIAKAQPLSRSKRKPSRKFSKPVSFRDVKGKAARGRRENE